MGALRNMHYMHLNSQEASALTSSGDLACWEPPGLTGTVVYFIQLDKAVAMRATEAWI